MKKFFTLRNILLLVAAVFGLVAFFISFGTNLTVTMDGIRGTLKGIIWGCKSYSLEGKDYPVPYKFGPSVLPMIGLILVLVGTIGAVAIGLLVKKPFAKWIVLCCAVVALAGSVMAFIVVGPFARAYVDAAIKAEGDTPTPEQYEQMLTMMKTQLENGNPTCVGSVLSGIFGIVAAGAAGVSQFLPEKTPSLPPQETAPVWAERAPMLSMAIPVPA